MSPPPARAMPGDLTTATVLALSWAAVCGLVLVAGWLLIATPSDAGSEFEQSAWADY